MAMDEFLMSEKLTLRPGVEGSILEKLGEERISKLKIVGDKEVDLSLYTQLVNDTGLSFGVDEQLAKEAIKAVSAEKQRIAEEVGSMLQLSVNIDTSPPESLSLPHSELGEKLLDYIEDGMIGVVMLVAYTTCIVVGGVFCSTYIELSRAGKMTFPIVNDLGTT
ncbi:hypothetical protein ACFX19_020974 [Malus domestica]